MTALIKVDFSLQKGEIRALMGENGAGKSSLIKLMTGVYERDDGQMFLEGREKNPHSPYEAQTLGISTVYQEVNLIPTLTVAENIFLGRQPTRAGALDWKKMNAGAEAALDRLNIELNVRQLLSDYSIAIQQMVAIARAVDISAKILVLDEPTSSLAAHEVEQLFAIMRVLKGQGMGIIFVTHFLDQVYAISDTTTILRNGELVGNFETAALSEAEIDCPYDGEEFREIELKSVQSGADFSSSKETLAEAKNLGKKGSIEPFDLTLKKGEVLGLAGLLGAEDGRRPAELLFDIAKADQGQISVDGKPVAITSPREAIAAGFAFCSEDRKASGIIGELTVRENIVLALQASKGWLRLLSKKTQGSIAESYIKILGISTPNASKKIKELSGGTSRKS